MGKFDQFIDHKVPPKTKIPRLQPGEFQIELLTISSHTRATLFCSGQRIIGKDYASTAMM